MGGKSMLFFSCSFLTSRIYANRMKAIFVLNPEVENSPSCTMRYVHLSEPISRPRRRHQTRQRRLSHSKYPIALYSHMPRGQHDHQPVDIQIGAAPNSTNVHGTECSFTEARTHGLYAVR